jgi:membrane-associated protease RseP (regulator of RpoE activity)
VTPFFWLMAALFGWGLTQMVDQLLGTLLRESPGQGVLLVLWIGAVFFSILIHELGHALAMRYYGMDCYVVLYHFGGIAVPDSGSSFTRFGSASRRSDGKSQIIISAAGPAAQLILAAVVLLLTRASGYVSLFRVPFVEWLMPYLEEAPFFPDPQFIPSATLDAFIFFLLLPSIFWALLNLLPVYPLDGGQIAREVFTMFSPSGGIRNSLMLSIVTGGAVAVYALTNNQVYLGIMFGMLAFSSYQALQAYSGRGGGFGGRPW